MKKLLLITDAWAPQVNGVVTALVKTKELLENRGYEILVIEPSQFGTLPLPFYPEIRLSLFPRRRIARTITEFAPDYIHIATEGPLGFSARRICMREKLQFTSSYHTNYDRYADTYVAKLSETVIALLRRFHAPAATTMVATPSLMTLLEKRKFKNLSLWPLGVDTELFRPRKNPPIAELKKPVFTLFGRLAKDKNPDEFFNLDLPGTKLVIGDGPERTRLEKKFVAHATFVGFKKSDELVRWLSLSDVLVFPSTNETFGLTIIEALACGVPVAAHDVMGPKDIITNGVDGILSEDLKEAALACLSIDKALPREKALRYSWDESVSAFLRLLTPVRGND